MPEQTPVWSAERRYDVERRAGEWLSSPQLRTLAFEVIGAAFGVLSPVALAQWSAENLDASRDQEVSLTTREPVLLELAERWGMLGTQAPQRDAYEATIMLGGTRTGNRLGTELAWGCAERKTKLGVLIAANAESGIGDPDPHSDRDARDGEWENVRRFVAQTFGPLKPKAEEKGETDARAWRDASFSSPTQPEIRLLAAPPLEGRSRANTADVFSFLQSRFCLSDYPHLLLITSAIYAPYQFFVAVPALLAAGAQYVEVIGTTTAAGEDRQLFATRLAQGTNDAIAAAVSVMGPATSSTAAA